jgi:SAM-dependent methyltransferase
MSERANAGKRLPYNKACGLEDFADPELIAVLREVYSQEGASEAGPAFPAGAERRKHWEVAMSVRALRDFGALRPDAEILGVGAGTETTVFYLTRHARRVVATDLYLAPGDWEREAHPLMLIAPERLAPMPFERDRLVVQHMDGRWLRFPDDSFDGIFSSGSIEHFGGFEDIAAAAYEMGRVLKPGGVLTLATELLLQGPPGSTGWPGVVLFSAETLRRQIIEASGLKPVDAPDLSVSERTLATGSPLVEMIREIENGRESFPHLVLTHDSQVFGSVHLTLRKTERYPVPDNAWARPSEKLREQVRQGEAEAGRRMSGPLPAAQKTQAPVAPSEPAAARPAPVRAPRAPRPDEDRDRIEELYRRWDAVRSRSGLDAASEGGSVRRAVGFMGRTATRVRDLGVTWDLQRDLFRALIDGQTAIGERLRSLEGEGVAEDLGARLARLEGELAGLRKSEADILGALDVMWSLHAKAGTIEESAGGGVDMANLRDRHEILRVRQTRLEGALADLREEIAALRTGASGALEASISRAVPLTPRDFAELLTLLEEDAPVGERAGAVEVSIQDVRAEDLLLAARRHFGGRLSSSGPSYRGPNDLWIHVDFTSRWDRPDLPENAAARLAPGGLFLLITAASSAEAPTHARLVLEEDREVSLATGGPVRVLTWRKVRGSTA